MMIEARLNQSTTNGTHATQAEALKLPPLVFSDGTTFNAVDVGRRLAETLIDAKKTGSILSKPELCGKIYPNLSLRDASNELDLAAIALRHDMFTQRTAWQVKKVPDKRGGPLTYDIKKVPQSIPVELTPPPPQSDINGKKEEGQLSNERPRSHRKGKNVRNLTIEEKARQKMEKARRRERGEARIDQASQLEPISADFTDAILDCLIASSPDSLDKDLIKFLKTYSPNIPRELIEEFPEKYSSEQIRISVVDRVKQTFITTLNDLLNDRGRVQKDPTRNLVRTSKAKRIASKYGGLENLTIAIAEHFPALHLLRSVNA